MPRPIHPDATDELQVVCRIPTQELCYFRYTLEAYEGLCLTTTLTGGDGRVRLATSEGQRPQLEALLRALAKELPLEVEGWSSVSREEDSGDR